MPKYATGQGPSLAAQLPEGSLASRALAGLKTAGKWIGLDEDASVEPSVMGGIGPAITMVTKRPLTQLLRRLAPRDEVGRVLDPSEFPNITDAVQQVVETYPRVMSHAEAVLADLPTGNSLRGLLSVPNHVTQRAMGYGRDAGLMWRRFNDQPMATMRLNTDIEDAGALSTVAHEANHLAGFIADPRTYFAPGEALQRSLRNQLARGSFTTRGAENMAYHIAPHEVSSRSAGALREAAGRMDHIRANPRVGSFPRYSMREEANRQTVHPAMADPTKAPKFDELQQLWRTVREDLRSRLP